MSELLHHRVGGRKGARSLLLIHPMGADYSFWDDCRGFWDTRFRTIACNLRGVGRSPQPRGMLTPASHVADLAALVGHLEVHETVVIGCAAGSMTAVHYAASHPGRVSALILANPGIRTRKAARAALARRAHNVRREGMSAAVSTVMNQAFAGCDDEALRARFVDQLMALDPLLYAAAIDGLQHADTVADLDKVRCPTLLVPGSMDRLFPPDHAQEIKEHIPSAELTLVEGGAHFIPYQRPAEFAVRVSNFLDRYR